MDAEAMTMTGPGRRLRSLLIDGPELLAITALALAVTLWGWPTRGTLALSLAPFGLLLAYFCILTGRLVIGTLRLSGNRFNEIPTVILVGFLTLNTLLLVAALALPLSLSMDALLIATGIIGWKLLIGPSADRLPSSLQGLACFVLSLIAATFWSLDSINPTFANDGNIVFRPWVDGYVHACLIRIFRDVHGLFSLEHFSMAGEPAPLYHYASFPIPALLAATTGTSCYLAFATFLVPFGMSLTGLAAFMMARWWWSPGAGTAAAVGVLLIPDASQYGIANPFLGYHWLAEIGPTWVYGIAMMAVAWVLVFEGCRSGRLGLLATGFAAAGLTVAFKAHLFVTNAFLIWVYPAFFLRGFSARIRLAWLVFSIITFVPAVRISQGFSGIPLLRLDGSGLKPYLSQVAFNLNDAGMKQLLAVGPATSWSHDVLTGLVHLTFGTFGFFPLVFSILSVFLILRRRETDLRGRVETTLFPFFVTANYLIMALGLALDNQTNHMADELLHRPLVWAYFAVAAWTTGCLYEVAIKSILARAGPARVIGTVMLLALLSVPFFLGQGVQVGPGWGKDLTSIRVPVGLVRSAEFLRDHSDRGDTVQNSEDDRWIILSALAERPVYVADTWRTSKQNNEKIIHRLDELTHFRRLTDSAEIVAFAARRKISWYVLDPATKVNWPASILSHPSFESGGFRVYRFSSTR